VIAYDTGALAQVVAQDGLVPLGDELEFAKRIEAATDGHSGGGPALQLDAWRQVSRQAWIDAIGTP